MTTIEQLTTLDAVRALVPEITARVDEIEQARTLPRDLVDDLVAAGCFRALVPRSHGGDELAFADALAVIEELAGPTGRWAGRSCSARRPRRCSVTCRRRRSTLCTPPAPT